MVRTAGFMARMRVLPGFWSGRETRVTVGCKSTSGATVMMTIAEITTRQTTLAQLLTRPSLTCCSILVLSCARLSNSEQLVRDPAFHPKFSRSCFWPQTPEQATYFVDAESLVTISLNALSSRIRSNAPSSSDLAFVIPFSSAFFNSPIACFLSPTCAAAVATR